MKPLSLLFALVLAGAASAQSPRVIEPAGVRTLAIAYYEDGTPTGAGASFPVEVRVRENSLGGPQVGVVESATGASGLSWRASAFVATFVATSALNLSPSDVEVTVAVRGRIDGPSAGALLTSSLVAALTGTKVDPTVTMSGTINPDGTVGPVGGLFAKVSAAAAAKQTRVGVPVGQLSPDLAAHARRAGVQLVELGSLRDAFKLLTGRTLPTPAPLAPEEMAVSTRSAELLTAAAREMLGQVDLTRPVVTAAQRLNLEAARRYVASAEGWLAKKNPSAALDDATTAAALLEANRLGAGPRDGSSLASSLQAEANAAVKRLDEALTHLGRRQPSSPAAWSHRLRTYGMLGRAHSMVLLALRDLRAQASAAQTPQTANALLENAARFATEEGMIVGSLASANVLAFKAMLFEGAAPRGAGASVDPIRLDELGEWMIGMADTNLAYFDALLLQPIAESRRMALDEVRPAMEAADRGYALARAEVQLARRYLQGSADEKLYALALGERAYVTSAQLVAREYALEATKDGSGRITDVKAKAAFANMLEEAERAARVEAAGAQAAIGTVPVDAALSYLAARQYREGSVDDQYQALREFWWSSVSSTVAAELFRKATPAVSDATP